MTELKEFPKKEEASAEKNFPKEGTLVITLQYTPDHMEKVRNWYKKTREELGDNFIAEFDESRLMYEAVIGGAVVPTLLGIDEQVLNNA